MIVFELLVNKLFLGEAINRNCLRILPPLVNILVRSLCRRSIASGETGRDANLDSLEENHMQEAIEGWLQRLILFPPLILWQTGEDMEEWFWLVISCYPLSTMEGIQALKLERNISAIERTLLLELFRKQRHVAGVTAAANQLPAVQMLLSKLLVISLGYCWKEFNEEDWEFLLSNIRRWIQSAVVMMEEVAETATDAITGMSTSSDNLEIISQNLKQIVMVSDSFPIDIATNALLSFSLFSGPLILQQAEDANNVNPLRTERWDPIKDRILEAIIGEDTASYLVGDTTSDQDPSRLDLSPDKIHLREEISCMIVKLPYEVLEMDLVAPQRVNIFLAWSLLLSHLWLLPSSSSARERLVQYIQDSANSVILAYPCRIVQGT